MSSLHPEDQELVRNYCRGCVKFTPETIRCEAFLQPYPLWGAGDCWAREEDPEAWVQTQIEIEVHRGTREDLARERIREAQERERRLELEIMEAYDQDIQHRVLKRKGRSEKSDRTHKLFGPQRMKDNRLIVPWTEGD